MSEIRMRVLIVEDEADIRRFVRMALESEAYEAFARRTMVTRAQGKMIDYVGIDSKTGRYLAVDPATMKPVPAPQAIPVSELH